MRTPTNEPVSSDILDPATGRSAGKRSGSERRCILSGKIRPREDMLRLAISPDGTGAARSAGTGARSRGLDRRGARRTGSRTGKGRLARRIGACFQRGEAGNSGGPPQIDRERAGAGIAGPVGHGNACRGMSCWDRTGSRKMPGRAAWRCSCMPPMRARTGPGSWTRRGASGARARGRANGVSACHWSRAALSVALGRDNVVHLALADDAGAARVFRAMGRLQLYSGPTGPDDNREEAADTALFRRNADELNA